MPTLQALLDDIDTRLPNTFTATQKASWMDQIQNEVWRYMASTETWQFLTLSGQSVYATTSTTNAPSLRFDMIKSVIMSNSTTIDGKEGYDTLKYAGRDEEITTGMYFNPSTGGLGIYPSDSTELGAGYNVKVEYESAPTALSTATLTSVPSINVEFQDILKFRCMKVIAQSGNNPDVELANNYQREEDAIMKKIRTDYYKKKARKPRGNYRRSEGWYNG